MQRPGRNVGGRIAINYLHTLRFIRLPLGRQRQVWLICVSALILRTCSRRDDDDVSMKISRQATSLWKTEDDDEWESNSNRTYNHRFTETELSELVDRATELIEFSGSSVTSVNQVVQSTALLLRSGHQPACPVCAVPYSRK